MTFTVRSLRFASFQLSIIGLTLVLSACSTPSILEGDKIDYKSASKAPTLEIPPDLTQLAEENRYKVVQGSVSASSLQENSANNQVSDVSRLVKTAPVQLGDVRIERSGNQRWLVVKANADTIWKPVREFWEANGFVLTMQQPELGIMETDWAENRAKLPHDFIRNSIGKIFDSVYSTGERDRFRTRIERATDGSTEIFISHKGMIEVYANNRKDSTVWQPRATDVELEAEFLRRLMLKLSGANETGKPSATTANASPSTESKSVAQSPTSAYAKVSLDGGFSVLTIQDGFDRAWRRVGLSLDRTGFTVEDRDRNKGIYFVRYVPVTADKKEPGLFSKLFGSDTAQTPLKYQIEIKESSAKTASAIKVMNEKGEVDSSENAKKIIQLLADDLK